ncbi:hypothetical protein LCGC14_0586240 [marine sediment metagenome]|uniref:Uncharacterized protein n=1 Tax=marine sediment metagenome TaxID=412755 RepID=A0A0F9UN38_9ZZZZ
MWYVINHFPKLDDITEFEDKSKAVVFYNKNCSDGKNCWGVIVERPEGFFKSLEGGNT